MSLDLVAENRCFGGWHKQYVHRAQTVASDMRFSVFMPSAVETKTDVPVLY